MSIGTNKHRDEQFKNITTIRVQYEADGNPIIESRYQKEGTSGYSLSRRNDFDLRCQAPFISQFTVLTKINKYLTKKVNYCL